MMPQPPMPQGGPPQGMPPPQPGGPMPPQGGQPPMGPQQQPQQPDPTQQQQPPAPAPVPPEEDFSDINRVISSTNLVPAILKRKDGKQTLNEIGSEIRSWYTKDLASRKQWDDQNKEYMKLACQVMETKNFPWNKASNVKFPILSTAALQFSSRAYPSLVSGFDIVKARAIGGDPDGTNNAIAQAISTHLSYQLLYEMTGWDEDMDKLCFILPIIGTAFKKTYYDPSTKTNKSELVLARDLIVDYWAKDLETAHRKTHRIFRTCNEIIERQRQEVYINDKDYLKDAGLDQGGNIDADIRPDEDLEKKTAPSPDKATPRLLLECHTYWDLDDDDYDEPYIITIDYESQKVLRIVARFYKEGVELDSKGKAAKIVPCEYFTKFGFIPNPDGGFYDLGFGLLLGGVNGAVNTLINQLIDAGTLSTLQGGFISKGIRIKQGEMKFKPGEWKAVNNFGDDLKKGIFPLPVKEPSNVLMELLSTLSQSGKELASIAEIFTGKMPGQNTPASTTMATIEQGMKVFTSIYKRIYRALGQEFEKLYSLNKLYMPDEGVEVNVEVSGETKHAVVKKKDYGLPTIPQAGKPFIRIVPAADPNMVSETQRLVKSQGLLELIQLGTINPQTATQQILEQQGQANIKQLLQVPPPPVPPEIQIKQQELQLKQQQAQQDQQAQQAQMQHDEQMAQFDIQKMQLQLQLEQQKAMLTVQQKSQEANMKSQEHQLGINAELQKQQLNMTVAKTTAEMNLKHEAASNAQELAFKNEKGKQDIRLAKAKAAAVPKSKPTK